MTNLTFSVTPIRAFHDNYIWAIQATNSRSIALVDPGDAKVCIQYIAQHQLQLSAILLTHHHSDHIGGVQQLQYYCQQQGINCPVYGPAHEAILAVSHPLVEADEIQLFNQLNFRIIDVPGHTSGHIAYVNEHALFCGDTLFSGGCGRIFEGTPTQLHHSLTKLTQLPSHTSVYCAHEYTLNNLAFAVSIEPNNQQLLDYQKQAQQLRAQNKPTIPSNMALEQQINPFLRCNQSQVIQQVEQLTQQRLATDIAVFTALRQLKDNF